MNCDFKLELEYDLISAPERKRLSKQLFQRAKAAENEKKSFAPEDVLLLDHCFNEKTKDLEDVEELHLGFFGDRDAMFDLLEKESKIFPFLYTLCSGN